MLFPLTPEAQARAAASQALADQKQAQFAAMTDASLISTARFYMRQMTPLDWAPGEPVYDATMFHIILPELIGRLEQKP